MTSRVKFPPSKEDSGGPWTLTCHLDRSSPIWRTEQPGGGSAKKAASSFWMRFALSPLILLGGEICNISSQRIFQLCLRATFDHKFQWTLGYIFVRQQVAHFVEILTKSGQSPLLNRCFWYGASPIVVNV